VSEDLVLNEPRPGVSPLYAMGQLQRAVDAFAAAVDATGRARAEAKIAKWRQVIAGMRDGTVTVGSREPVVGTPGWVTLEVAHGGFATGRLLAENPPGDTEITKLAAMSAGVPGVTDRERLNLWFLGDPGQQELLAAVASGRYRVEVPEEAALPVVAWLLSHDQFEAALDLVAELRPWMHRLRFTPRLDAAPHPAGPVVRLVPAGAVAAALHDVRPRPQIAAMRATLNVWNPLFDQLLTLWCDTVDGDLPRLAELTAPATNEEAAVVGGWPCRRWPDDWTERRRTWLADYEHARRTHGLSGRHHHPKSNFTRLRLALEKCEARGSGLTGRDVGWIRRILANTISRWGSPGSELRSASREVHVQVANRPAHADLARVLAARLAAYPPEGGIASLADIGAPVGENESTLVPRGEPIPAHLLRKAARSLEAPVEELISEGIIGSAEVLAGVLPQITAQVLAAGIEDRVLAALYAQAYSAFRRRRSLLLLDLQHQVRFTELPWIAAVQPLRSRTTDGAAAARQVLTQVTEVALTNFPHTILPNPLVSEMASLAAQAELSLPLVQEVAADIFMGTFTMKWPTAAKAASASLAGTLYARYYDLPGPAAWVERTPKRPNDPQLPGKRAAEDFAALCVARSAEARAGIGRSHASYIAGNGAIIEQSQILTTHNLAVLVGALGLGDRFAVVAPDLAVRCFEWVIRRLGQQPPSWHSRLQAVKNAAYAWRQAIYFLSLCDQAGQDQAINRLRDAFRDVDSGLATRLSPAVDGLDHVVAGGRFSTDGTVPAPSRGRRFLGWSAGPHWVLGAAEQVRNGAAPAKAE
jgi:hypothetical protein